MNDRGIKPARVLVRAAEVPTETDRFATALGIAGRSKLSNNQLGPIKKLAPVLSIKAAPLVMSWAY